MAAAAAKPVETMTTTAAAATPVETSVITPPALAAAPAITPPVITTSAADLLFKEHLAAASRKGIAGTDIDMTASGAFFGAAEQPFTGMGAMEQPVSGIDAGELEREAAVTFQAAMPVKTASSERETERWNERAGSKVFNIQNVNLNTDDIHSLLDIARLIEMAVAGPAEVTV